MHTHTHGLIDSFAANQLTKVVIRFWFKGGRHCQAKANNQKEMETKTDIKEKAEEEEEEEQRKAEFTFDVPV